MQFNEVDGSWCLQVGTLDTGRVSVSEQTEVDVAYLRHTGPFQGAGPVFGELFAKVTAWARSVGIDPTASGTLALYHDDPNLTDDELLRFSACVPVPDDVTVDPPINRTTISGGLYATAAFVLADDQYSHAWNGLLGTWLPRSGYEPDDRHYFERFGPNPTASDRRRSVEICVPIRPLSTGT